MISNTTPFKSRGTAIGRVVKRGLASEALRVCASLRPARHMDLLRTAIIQVLTKQSFLVGLSLAPPC
jgi:hypothetical protein